ncbi:MAG: ABC transporter permease [Tepidimonas sp.]|uniref:ABC transporter permease n=1 Tax=Tepidimonas sp. TaxID=2002775 RepID=UPI004054CFA8
MIPSLRAQSRWRWLLPAYAGLFFVFVLLPLAVVAVFAFNDAPHPTPPWQGATLDWFVAARDDRVGLLRDAALLRALGVSAWVAFWVALLSVLVGTCNAWLLERTQVPGRSLLGLLSLAPLVIPGVVLGISILAFASRVAHLLESWLGWQADWLRPGLPLVILGQVCYIASIATLTVAARLKRMDRTWEEAALDLGASRWATWWTITFPYLRPALSAAAAMAFLMSFENFNTTLMLVGSEPPLTILMYGRMREGSTPVLNAVSVLLMLGSGLLALGWWWRAARRRDLE